MEYGKHLSNIYDHRKADAQMLHAYSYEAQIAGVSATLREWQYHLDWIAHNIVGPPKATEAYTREQLEAMGMIGIYAPAE